MIRYQDGVADLTGSPLVDVVLAAARDMDTEHRALAADNLAQMTDLVTMMESKLDGAQRLWNDGDKTLSEYAALHTYLQEITRLTKVTKTAEDILVSNDGNLDPNLALFTAAVRISRTTVKRWLDERQDAAREHLIAAADDPQRFQRFASENDELSRLRLLAAVLEAVDARVTEGDVTLRPVKKGDVS